jgi:hypothetical protein
VGITQPVDSTDLVIMEKKEENCDENGASSLYEVSYQTLSKNCKELLKKGSRAVKSE